MQSLESLARKLVPYLKPWFLSLDAGYVESGWLPTVGGGTAPGLGTYTQQLGHYTRIGNVVVASGRVIWTAHSGTGPLYITLPFVAANQDAGLMRWAGTAYVAGVPRTGEQYMPYLRATEDRLYFDVSAQSGSLTNLIITYTGNIIFTVTYFVE